MSKPLFQTRLKSIYTYNFNLWKWHSFQNLEMFILCYDTFGIGGYCTIHKLIVILISIYQAKRKM